jgi:hypothetical protein
MRQIPAVRVVHHTICRHQIEVAVQPPRAELYWHDERWVDPINTQLRFEAVVFNADRGVIWQVLAPDGGPGHGTIDATGLYQAPDKGPLASGTTDVVVATVRADPLRKAFAWVTLVGLGPSPAPAPRIEIWPKFVTLFYETGNDNAYIDVTNKLWTFRAFPRHATNSSVQWSATLGIVVPGPDTTFGTYIPPGTGTTSGVTVTARLQANPSVSDDARVELRNYIWPGL